MAKTSKRFRQDVSNLMLRRNMTKTNKAVHKCLADKMTIKFNVLGALMKDGVFGYIYSGLIDPQQRYLVGKMVGLAGW